MAARFSPLCQRSGVPPVETISGAACFLQQGSGAFEPCIRLRDCAFGGIGHQAGKAQSVGRSDVARERERLLRRLHACPRPARVAFHKHGKVMPDRAKVRVSVDSGGAVGGNFESRALGECQKALQLGLAEYVVGQENVRKTGRPSLRPRRFSGSADGAELHRRPGNRGSLCVLMWGGFMSRVRKVLSAVQIGFDAVDVDQDNRGIEFMNLGHRRPGSLSRQEAI